MLGEVLMWAGRQGVAEQVHTWSHHEGKKTWWWMFRTDVLNSLTAGWIILNNTMSAVSLINTLTVSNQMSPKYISSNNEFFNSTIIQYNQHALPPLYFHRWELWINYLHVMAHTISSCGCSWWLRRRVEYTWQRLEVRGDEAGWWSGGGEQVYGAVAV